MNITSVGACTAVGLDARSAAAAVRAGVSGFGKHAYLVDQAGDRVVVAQAPVTNEDFDTVQRLRAMAAAALHEALAPRPAGETKGELPVFLAVPTPRPGLPRADIQGVVNDIHAELSQLGFAPRIQEIEAGHTGGLLALQACREAVAARRCDWALAGGVDSWLDADAVETLEATDRLHGPANAWGFIPGEAAAFCVVADHMPTGVVQTALRIEGFGMAAEPVPRRGEEPCLGHGLTAALRGALAGLPPGQRIDEVFCDHNGEWDRADEYGFALVRTSEHFVDGTATRTPADCWGDVGAATGTLLTVLAWQAAQRRWLRGAHALIWASSDGAHRAALRLVAQY